MSVYQQRKAARGLGYTERKARKERLQAILIYGCAAILGVFWAASAVWMIAIHASH